MSEPIIQTTKFDQITDQDFLLEMYIKDHPAINFYDNAEQANQITNFVVESCVQNGTTVAIDSFLINHATLAIDDYYEFDSYKNLKFFENIICQGIFSIYNIPTIKKYDNVIAIGHQSFKYMTVEQYVSMVEYLLKITTDSGNLVICLPKLHFQYHRLRYKPQEIISQINQQLSRNVVSCLETYYDFYL